MTKHNKQAGGTLLGLIVGLVIGLGIALVVAVTVTKTPMPFMDKGGRADKAPALTSEQAGDPNRPLYGKQDAARQAARELTREEAPAADAAAAKAAPKQLAPDNAEIKIPAVKPGEAQTAKADPARSDNPEDKWTYFLQAGAFREQADAESTRAKLALQGLEASISEKQSEAGTLYRVRLGPYSQLEAMNRVRTKLSDAGMDVAVIRVAK
jgi:cell division protein FtsN